MKLIALVLITLFVSTIIVAITVDPDSTALHIIPISKSEPKSEQYKKLDNQHLLSAIIYAECGNCPEYEMYLTGSVVLNRLKDGRWPCTIEDVINQERQFTKIRNGSKFTKRIAADLLQGIGHVPDIYYFCTKDSDTKPMSVITIIGHLHYYGK